MLLLFALPALVLRLLPLHRLLFCALAFDRRESLLHRVVISLVLLLLLLMFHRREESSVLAQLANGTFPLLLVLSLELGSLVPFEVGIALAEVGRG